MRVAQRRRVCGPVDLALARRWRHRQIPRRNRERHSRREDDRVVGTRRQCPLTDAIRAHIFPGRPHQAARKDRVRVAVIKRPVRVGQGRWFAGTVNLALACIRRHRQISRCDRERLVHGRHRAVVEVTRLRCADCAQSRRNNMNCASSYRARPNCLAAKSYC